MFLRSRIIMNKHSFGILKHSSDILEKIRLKERTHFQVMACKTQNFSKFQIIW